MARSSQLADSRSAVRSELYDPAIGGWTLSGDLNRGRMWHTATLLPGGRVLAAGGFDLRGSIGQQDIDSAELYDQATGTWTFTVDGHSNYIIS